MKPGSKDIKVFIKFDEAELELLKDNTWQMAESFGLDRRIANLTGKREVGFYLWDLECIEMVVDDLKADKDTDKILVYGLYNKILSAIDLIGENRNIV